MSDNPGRRSRDRGRGLGRRSGTTIATRIAGAVRGQGIRLAADAQAPGVRRATNPTPPHPLPFPTIDVLRRSQHPMSTNHGAGFDDDRHEGGPAPRAGAKRTPGLVIGT